jgi:hypothetical protein
MPKREEFKIKCEERSGKIVCETSMIEDNKSATCRFTEFESGEPQVNCRGNEEIAKRLREQKPDRVNH